MIELTAISAQALTQSPFTGEVTAISGQALRSDNYRGQVTTIAAQVLVSVAIRRTGSWYARTRQIEDIIND